MYFKTLSLTKKTSLNDLKCDSYNLDSDFIFYSLNLTTIN